jgi:hypothetical protein
MSGRTWAALAIVSIGALLFAPVPASAAADGRSAVVVRDVLSGDRAVETQLSDAVAAAGYEVASVTVDELQDRLRENRPALLVIPDGHHLPVSTVPAVTAYLSGGGHLVACGVPLWDGLVARANGKWLTRADYDLTVGQTKPQNVLFDWAKEDLVYWRRSTNAREPAPLVATEAGPDGARVLHVTVPRLTGWETLSRRVEHAFADGHQLTCFRAKGSAETTQLSVEWEEKDGARWVATVNLTQEWKDYALSPETFHPWQPPKGRGGPGDHLRVENVANFVVGLALSHTNVPVGKHDYWISSVGTAAHPYGQGVRAAEVPALETVSPYFAVYPITTDVVLSTPKDLAIAAPVSINGSSNLAAIQPRPSGAGFDKGRDWRYQVLLEARSSDGDYRGAVATLLVNDNKTHGHGVWAAFTPTDPAFYAQPAVRQLVTDVAAAVRRGVFLKEGGSDHYTVFEDQPVRLGARVVTAPTISGGNYAYKVTVAAPDARTPDYARQMHLPVRPDTVDGASETWRPRKWPDGGYVVTTELLEDEKVIDRLRHEVHAWRPSPEPSFIKARDGAFYLAGEPWKAHGVNYMPSSGIGVTDNELFEHWTSARAYDPEVIDRDLRRVQAMGLNAVSVFMYAEDAGGLNMLDFLRRCRDLGLHVNLSLRPGTPMRFEWEKVRGMIESHRLAQNDTVFAYDLAWEPSHGSTAEQQQTYRRLWRRWLDQRYGSVGKAEKAWGFSAARDVDGKVQVPTGKQLTEDGGWRKMVADYRLCLDGVLGQFYADARRLVRAVDSNHAVSFRMSVAGDPTANDPGTLFYDFYGLRDAVDVWAPEAYGRIGKWDRVKEGAFTQAYARLCDPRKPLVWAEVGFTAWDSSSQRTDAAKLEFEAEYFRDFYRMMSPSGANGVFFWWYPGGYRYNERSDFGIINPDGTDRPATKVIRDQAPFFLRARSPKPYDRWVEIDRDADARGLYGIHQRVGGQFWELTEQGHHVGLRWKHEPQGAPGAE